MIPLKITKKVSGLWKDLYWERRSTMAGGLQLHSIKRKREQYLQLLEGSKKHVARPSLNSVH